MKNVAGYRPPGGTIEFGERGAATVVRELREELGADVVEPRYLGTLENIFECVEANGAAFTCVWSEIDIFAGDALYPAGLLDLLRAS